MNYSKIFDVIFKVSLIGILLYLAFIIKDASLSGRFQNSGNGGIIDTRTGETYDVLPKNPQNNTPSKMDTSYFEVIKMNNSLLKK